MNFQREAYVPEPLIYHALSAFMEIYELMGKYVEYHDSQLHITYLLKQTFLSLSYPGIQTPVYGIITHNIFQ